MNDDIEAIETTIPRLESFYTSYDVISNAVTTSGGSLQEFHTSTTSSDGVRERREALKVHMSFVHIECIIYLQAMIYVYTYVLVNGVCWIYYDYREGVQYYIPLVHRLEGQLYMRLICV